ncbi:inner membrane CreD family protein [Campylobacter coli]|uniref:inner membrane CreD family protein n=1 Tax=Campylobacter coli TaxID=195 RepID=UPI000B2ECFD9|nr:inner membrane CreD family protein [Campylobacter coli]
MLIFFKLGYNYTFITLHFKHHGQKRFAIVMATILFILYLCLFIMLKQDEYALLIGTFIAMFGFYAAMYFTRNLNKDYHQG